MLTEGAVQLAVATAALILLLLADCEATTNRCNDKLCASVVSKCLLTQACGCEINRQSSECSCCHNCTQCLGADYPRCCSCLGLCEPSNDVSLINESQVGDIPHFNALFEAFTSAPDKNNRWTSYTYPVEATLEEFARKADIEDLTPHLSVSGGEEGSSKVQVNCTVMYWSECLSVSKCQDYCSQSGAASYRYFFDGCCECVGVTCLNYGLKESRCARCSKLEDDGPEDGTFTNEVDVHSKP